MLRVHGRTARRRRGTNMSIPGFVVRPKREGIWS